ncbi:FtsX-like permease family protein [Mucilaginibacter sabulilitoris]|uniref:FtsX-like permease family protein n=1 Tax=Mucilaginibacter sabulilitoris TaxID=1173583 RepID=A0ABZ0TEX1_9SPHI|nr:ABC transporter permease [Mucilaginibacter sabulilitoris]WPU91086.1 FtsX-like permease family protein [Mucilaginibacter sabulilitoris]
MIKNYFKIAWRNLIRNKGFSITNLLGLTIGITCTIFIFLWVKNELTYDKAHANYKTIYQVVANRDFKNSIFTDKNMVFPLAKALESGYPQIKNAVLTSHLEQHQVNFGETRIKKHGYYVGGRYFDMFSWKFIKGNAAVAITDPLSIVITESTAKSLFGSADPINKTIKIDNNEVHKVTAVLADLPGNTTQQFDFIIPYNFSSADVKNAMTRWEGSSWEVYIQTVDNPNIPQLEKYITGVMFQHNKDKISTYFTFPMNKWHLYSDFKDGKNVGGMIEYVRFFTVIAIIILLIACVNFMNLSTARSEKRAKEVGIRKTLGSDKKQLISQFFLESMILVLIAFICAIMAVYLLLPSFNLLVGKQLYLNISEPVFWMGAIIIILFTGVIAGSYPALYLSSFSPVKVLKGTFVAGKGAIAPRKILVVFQFVGSILLISATIIVYQQIQHIKDRNIGYNPNNLIMTPSTAATDKNFASIKNDLLKTGLIKNVTRTSWMVTEISWRSGPPDWEGKPANANIIFSNMTADVDYVKTMGIKLLQGHEFTGMPSDTSAVLLNKAAVEAMQIKKPIGMQLRYDNHKYTVIGVTDNVVMLSPYMPVDPMMVFSDHNNSGYINLRLNNDVKPQQAIQLLRNIYAKYSPADIFEYQFVDDEFGKKFLTEELISRITNIFAGLAIFICCIGLAGLASFTIEKRFREIGIRKVLGATIQQLLVLISTEFLKLVLIAFVIATPLAWWLMHNWLQKYTYHVNISIWLFGVVGILILLLTLIVVSLNTMRAAMANPVKSLRSE